MKPKHLVFKSTLWTAGILFSTIYAPETAVALAQAESSNEPELLTIQQVAEKDAQSFTVPSNVKPLSLERSSYSATSIEEVNAIKAKRAEEARLKAEAEKAKAEEEARQKAAAEARAQMHTMTASASSAPAPKMNGNFAWPLNDYSIFSWEQNGFRSATRPNHNGLDMLAPAMTPIYAIHDGTVIMSSESSGGWGVVVKVRGVIDGQSIITTYAHMTNGTRQVQVGDTVSAGTLLGNVGMTGRATANHLHLETEINGQFVDPKSWLEQNLGPVG